MPQHSKFIAASLLAASASTLAAPPLGHGHGRVAPTVDVASATLSRPAFPTMPGVQVLNGAALNKTAAISNNTAHFRPASLTSTTHNVSATPTNSTAHFRPANLTNATQSFSATPTNSTSKLPSITVVDLMGKMHAVPLPENFSATAVADHVYIAVPTAVEVQPTSTADSVATIPGGIMSCTFAAKHSSTSSGSSTLTASTADVKANDATIEPTATATSTSDAGDASTETTSSSEATATSTSDADSAPTETKSSLEASATAAADDDSSEGPQPVAPAGVDKDVTQKLQHHDAETWEDWESTPDVDDE